MLDDSELDQLSLIDAVLPDIISLRHSLAGNKIIKSDLPFKNDTMSDEVYHVNSVPADNMEYNGVGIDGGSHKILKGHDSEVNSYSEITSL